MRENGLLKESLPRSRLAFGADGAIEQRCNLQENRGFNQSFSKPGLTITSGHVYRVGYMVPR